MHIINSTFQRAGYKLNQVVETLLECGSGKWPCGSPHALVIGVFNLCLWPATPTSSSLGPSPNGGTDFSQTSLGHVINTAGMVHWHYSQTWPLSAGRSKRCRRLSIAAQLFTACQEKKRRRRRRRRKSSMRHLLQKCMQAFNWGGYKVCCRRA